MPAPALQIRELEFAYPRGAFRLAVPELDVAAGSKAAIIGPSGCGKSTLAHLAAGILVPDAGTVQLAGTEVSALADAARRAFRIREVGFIFQEFELLDYLPARANLLLPFTINRRVKASPDDLARADELAASLGFADKLTRLPAQLSGGERQRLAVARALVTRPALVLADEPTGNLDPDNARRVMERILEHAESAGSTVIAITHDHSLLPLFDQVIDVGGLNRS